MSMKREYNIFIKGRVTTRRTAVRHVASGQMFIIGAILILIALIAVKNLLGVYSTFEEKRFEETLNMDKQIRNLKNEFGYILGIASLQSDINLSGIRFFYNFSDFVVNDIDAKVLYAFVFVNSTNQQFGVTVGNFLKDAINVTINATNSSPSGYTFTINNNVNVSRQFSSNINGTVNITLAYTQQNENITERFSMLASTQRFVAGFFDITVESKDEFVRSKEVYNRTW